MTSPPRKPGPGRPGKSSPGKPKPPAVPPPPRRPATPREPAFARDVVESIADPLVVYDAQWRVKYENAAALKAFRAIGHGSLIGRNVWTEFPDLAGTQFEREMRRAMETREPTSFVELRGRSGRWTEVRCYPLSHGGIVAVWKDITEHRRAEQAVRYLSSASAILASSLDHEVTCNALAQLVVPELADWCAISLLDEASGTIKLVAVAHVDPEKVKLVRSFDAHNPNSRDSRTRTAQVIRTGKPDLVPEITEEMIDQSIADPTYRAMMKQLGFSSVITVPLTVRDRVLGAMSLVGVTGGAHQRFTEADMALAQELARRAAIAVDNAALYKEAVNARAAAEAANSTKTAFLARMSHELRTPLNAIGGYVELLTMGLRGPLAPQQLEDLERIRRSQHHLLTLINDVLNYARVEAGRLQYDIRPVTVHEALGEVEAIFAPQLLKRGLTYRVESVAPDLTAQADPEKLQQILFNLVSNAAKFTPTGGCITLSARAEGSEVEIKVCDDGHGIPEDKLEKIFEPFVQLQQANHAQQGAGLGLAISRDLARAMNGELSASSEGKGATFVLRLPQAQQNG